MTTQEAEALWERKAAGDSLAREALILGYQGLVIKTRERMVPKVPVRIDAEDLRSEGYLALIRAVDRFDSARGVKFTSYAIALIRGQMLEYLRKEDWVPRAIRQKQKQLALAEEALAGLDLLLTLQQAAALRHQVSWDDVVVWGRVPAEDLTVADQCADPAPGPEALLEEQWDRETLWETISGLPQREREIMERHYEGEETFKAMSGPGGRSPTRLSQLHQDALTRLRERVPAEALR